MVPGAHVSTATNEYAPASAKYRDAGSRLGPRASSKACLNGTSSPCSRQVIANKWH